MSFISIADLQVYKVKLKLTDRICRAGQSLWSAIDVNLIEN